MAGPVRVQITHGAEDDLQAIYDRRLSRRGADGPDGAGALLDQLNAAFEGLADYPLRGAIPPELEVLGIVDWRQVSVLPHRIIYAFENGVVTIAMIADARRDFATLLEHRVLRAPLRD